MLTPILALVVIALVSLLAVRVGATALMMTGLSWDTASFQAYSAFFGVGFTTREAEMVVNHPVRRRIIRDLILAGNIGLTSALAALVVSFLQTSHSGEILLLVAGVSLGVMLLLTLSRVGWLQRSLDHVIQGMLERSCGARARLRAAAAHPPGLCGFRGRGAAGHPADRAYPARGTALGSRGHHLGGPTR